MTLTYTTDEVIAQVRGQVGFLTLNRPQAINALSLPMVRALYAQLVAWKDDPAIVAVAIRGSSKTAEFGHFCAGGDIRFLHQAGSTGNPQLEDFFTEEYALNHLIFAYPKPYIAFMDGIVMGGGMGISQGGSCRIVTAQTKMAMPETMIGLFPDVGGGYFLSRCPGAVGEWLALTGQTIGAADALDFGLADRYVDIQQQAPLWDALGQQLFSDAAAVHAWLHEHTATQVPSDVPLEGKALSITPLASGGDVLALIDRVFALPNLLAILKALEADGSPWACHTVEALRQRSPLMLSVTLEQIRRARHMALADVLRMERGLVRHCFYLRPEGSETLEGIRALAIDKDRQPLWQPQNIEEVSPKMWMEFFVSPWPDEVHPLAHLSDIAGIRE